jgi:hypothetical protein
MFGSYVRIVLAEHVRGDCGRGWNGSNSFGTNAVAQERVDTPMQTDVADRAIARTDAPADRPREVLDVRELGPPNPLTETLETLPELDEEVLVQVNDRKPQHLYPKLDDRGYAFETVADENAVLTAIWEPE